MDNFIKKHNLKPTNKDVNLILTRGQKLESHIILEEADSNSLIGVDIYNFSECVNSGLLKNETYFIFFTRHNVGNLIETEDFLSCYVLP